MGVGLAEGFKMFIPTWEIVYGHTSPCRNQIIIEMLCSTNTSRSACEDHGHNQLVCNADLHTRFTLRFSLPAICCRVRVVTDVTGKERNRNISQNWRDV